MADLVALKAELLAGHPVTGPYNADDALAAAELNAINRDGPPDGSAFLQYIMLERFRTGSLYGRLKMLSETRPVRAGNAWEMPPVPLGVADADIVPTQDQIAAAAAILRIVDTDTGFAVSLLDSRVDALLNDVGPNQGEAIGGGDKTALQALSQNVQSRATELGFSRVREATVRAARVL